MNRIRCAGRSSLTVVAVLASLLSVGSAGAARAADAGTCTTPARTHQAADGTGAGVSVQVPSGVVAAALPHEIHVRVQAGNAPLDTHVRLSGPAVLGTLERCDKGTSVDVTTSYDADGREQWDLGHVRLDAGRAVVFNLSYTLAPALGQASLPDDAQRYPFGARAGALTSPDVALTAAGVVVSDVTPTSGCAIDGTDVFACDVTVDLQNNAGEDVPAAISTWSMHAFCAACPVSYDRTTVRGADGTVDSFVGASAFDVGTIPASGRIEVPIHVHYLGPHGTLDRGLTFVRPVPSVVGVSRFDYGHTSDIDDDNAGTREVGGDITGEPCTQSAVTLRHARGPARLSMRVPHGTKAVADSHMLLARVRAGKHALDGPVRLLTPFSGSFAPIVEWCRDGTWQRVLEGRRHAANRSPVPFKLGDMHVPAHRIARFHVRYSPALTSRIYSFPRHPLDLAFSVVQGKRESSDATMTVAGFSITEISPERGCAINGHSVRDCDITVRFVNRADEDAPLWLFVVASHGYVSDDVEARTPVGPGTYMGMIPASTHRRAHFHVHMSGPAADVGDGGLLVRLDFERPGDPRGADYNQEATARYDNAGTRIGPIDSD